ncbi:hypothetical protein V5P93_006230 [Actinokineospora auranticolor]|uniref:TIR domain-containing protein n=1 Tax=Actinokineospora auranticolor TaxID=155976 RepID=A0A2S6GHY4_9PSEU|nr:hypothetical protein [Actinokineospora auranticolor]PPK64827.1 hypothetical protein CLV40_11766 [Actinokineospora auranticolor]
MTDLATPEIAPTDTAVPATPDYDIAISFAEEQRALVEQVVETGVQHGLTLLHGPERTHAWWAREAARDLPDARVRYFVAFVSTVDEFGESVLRAVKAGAEHVLPVLVDDVPVPPELLHPHVAYPRTGDGARRLVEVLAARVEAAEAAGRDRARVADVVREARALTAPAGTPVGFSRYAEQDATLRYLGEQFAAALPGLDRERFTGTAHVGDARIAVRVEQAGDTVYALDIQRGGIGGDETVNFVVGRHDVGSACSNGWARPVYAPGTGALLELRDLSLLGRGGDTRILDREELFTVLWRRINEVLADTVR